jgi:predicted Zn-dependent protease
MPENSIILLGGLGLGGRAFLCAGEKRCKEFLSGVGGILWGGGQPAGLAAAKTFLHSEGF